MIARGVLLLLLCWLSLGTVDAACVHHPIRHRAVQRQFLRQTGYPHGRPGYVVDHIVPLCLGGPDAVSNMQWSALAESYVKDKQERALCRHACIKK